MKTLGSARGNSVVFVTAPDLKVARRLAKRIVELRLAACVNLVPGIESHYWWQGKIESGSEVLMLIKTSNRCLPALEQAVVELHPYDTPEFIAFELTRGNERYLEWLKASVIFKTAVGRGRP